MSSASTKITLTDNRGTTTHTVGMQGISGYGFWCTLVGLIAYIVGYATPNWHKNGGSMRGIWEKCTCTLIDTRSDSEHQAVQAMATIGLIFVILTFLMSFLYMFVHSANKNSVLICYAVFAFLATLFIVIALVLFGNEHEKNLHYSFALACIAAILIFISGVFSLVQMSRAGLCRCC